MSFDTAAENAAFRKKHSLPFPLLCDTERAMGIAYGAAADAKAANARRVAVLIDEQGKVAQYWPKADARGFAEAALAALPK